ncbi:peptide chain release factor aRF-1 [Candidatus Woesearchaeota archaeon]|jgi:peptide chain release factor subunit 1|nr:peptide chain release factor aRF-1 [Candidatus Woesearchaeota archaeon]
MELTEKQKFQLKKLIKELGRYRGRHTELVSVYIPQGYDLNKIINHLNQEKGTATNIKSASTRKNVIDALERMIQHLKLFKKNPPNGLAVFSGNIAEKEGQSNVEVWSIEPPVPLKTRIYRCDKQFVLELLGEMCETKEVYGLIVMDRREGDIALLKGKSIIPLVHIKSNVPGKTRAGGQSAQRFERLREGAAKDFYKKLGDLVKDEFLNKKNLKGIIVGGPGPTKYDFIEGNFITDQVKKKIIAKKDLSYTGDFGIRELVEKSKDVLANEEISKEKNIMGAFFEKLAKDPGMVTYGEKEVQNALKKGAVNTLLVSESLDDEKIDELEETAKNLGSKLEIISTETREGIQLKHLGKIAAILRYKLR